jgi:hypothetical protein
MARFDVRFDPDQRLLILVAHGAIVVDDVVDAVETHFPLHPLRDVVWDFSGASLDDLRDIGLLRIARASARSAPQRGAGARTAFVAHGRLAEELLELFRTFAVAFSSRIEYRLFADTAAALQWLQSPRPAA